MKRSRGRLTKATPAFRKPKSLKKGVPAPATRARIWQFPDGRTVFAAAGLAAITWLAYCNSFSAGFVLDNKGLLLQDPRIRDFTVSNVHLILQHGYWWPNGEAGLYRPFTTLTYLFNYAVNGQNPAGYHCINLLLHLANVFLVYALVQRLLREFWPALFAAALWAVHPALTESVTNMIGRSDLLSALAVLSGFLMYLRSTESSGWRRAGWLTGVLAVTTIGVFSKESAVVIVGVIAAYELTWWKERKRGRATLLGLLATVVPIGVMLYRRWTVLSASPPAELPFTDNPIVGAGFWTGRITALEVIPRYLLRTFWPATLSSDYSYAQIPLAHGKLQFCAAALGVLLAASLLMALYRRSRTAFFLLAFAAVTFAPMANLLIPIGTIMAERFLYLPAIGLLSCLVMAVYAADKRVPVKSFAPVVLCGIAAAFTARTWLRNRDWRDERTMAEASVRTSPHNFKVHRLLADAIYAEDRTASGLDRAIAEAERSIAIVDSLPDAQNNRKVYVLAGRFYLLRGDRRRARDAAARSSDYQRAVQVLTRATSIDKSVRAAYDRRGGAEWAHLHSALPASERGDPEPRWMLAAAYWRLEDVPRAEAAARDALLCHPRDPEAYRQIATILAGTHNTEEAAAALMEGGLITSDPSFRLDLLNLYRQAPGESCALTSGSGAAGLNLRCEAVHKPFCAAYVEVIKAAMEDERWDAVQQERLDFVGKYGCPAMQLPQVLPN